MASFNRRLLQQCSFCWNVVPLQECRLRATPKFTRMLLGAALGYLVLAVGSLISSFFGVGNGMGLYGLSGFGPLLAIAGVAIASFFLILDFDQIEEGVRAGVPQEESWRAGFGLTYDHGLVVSRGAALTCNFARQ